jgi:small subunit ribosomal protein S3
MGQKINPIAFRLQVNRSWNSLWFTKFNYSTILHEDLTIRYYVQVALDHYNLLISKCIIKRCLDKTSIIIHVYQHDSRKYTEKDLILIKEIKKIIKKITSGKVFLKLINIKKLNKPKNINLISKSLSQYRNQKYFKSSLATINATIAVKSATLLSKFIAKELELNYRHTMFIDFLKKTLVSFLELNSSIKGIKVQVKGRLNGIDRSKKETIQEGAVPLHTLNTNIDYHFSEAYTNYGVFGIKVWICF